MWIGNSTKKTGGSKAISNPKFTARIIGTVDINLFRFIPAAILTFGNPSRKFSILENFTRRALQRKP